MLKSVNLSLSSLCGADCIFCPNGAKKSGAQKTMPFALAKKIIDEISSDEFAEKHHVSKIGIGENGDVFLNKECIEILRYIKLKLPRVSVECYTNFQHFTKDKAQTILCERLITDFHCNVDASSKENFFIAKGLDLQTVTKNILDFLELRKKLKNESPLHLHVLTLHSYINAVYHYLGVYPAKLKYHKVDPLRIKDDFQSVKKQWQKFLDPEKDKISKIIRLFLWAEREQADREKINYKEYTCPNLQCIKEQAYISPDGAWYACCYDSKCELVLGNIKDDTLDNIYSGPARQELLDLLERREFLKIGGPCRTVNCCQSVYYDSDDIKSVLQIKFTRMYAALRRCKNFVTRGRTK